MDQKAEIGVFGGSGLYEFAHGKVREIEITTPYGNPSSPITLCTIAGRKVAFLPRHGKGHTIPPHKINYRANIWALKELGVNRILAPSAVGSLQLDYKPGDFAINDQFVDRTNGREDTFYDGPNVLHVSTSEPYCPELRQLAIAQTKAADVTVHESGTCVVIQGPRFSTKSESRWYSNAGWELISMTQYPEVALARELAICYVNISLVTDYDAGAIGEHGHVETSDVVRVLMLNADNVKKVLKLMIENMPVERICNCANSLANAALS